MNWTNRIIFKYLFTALCIIFASSMVVYWLYKFIIEDKDVGVVDYVPIKDEDSWDIPLPVASLCVVNPFLEAKMFELKLLQSGESYVDFLRGIFFDEKFNQVNYNNVTMNIGDYLEYVFLRTRNGTDLFGSVAHDFVDHKESFNGFMEWYGFVRCFEIRTRGQAHLLDTVLLQYNVSRFLTDMGKSGNHGESSIRLLFHHPGQYLLQVTMPDVITLGKANDYAFKINDIEIIKSRNSRNRKCTPYDDKRSFDDMVREKHIVSNNCRAPYFRPFQNFSKCSTKKTLKSSIYEDVAVREKYYPASCQRLSKISYEVIKSKNYTTNKTDPSLHLWLKYPKYFRIITQSKQVDIHTLIGNIGGYIGLFLGDCLYCYVDLNNIRNYCAV